MRLNVLSSFSWPSLVSTDTWPKCQGKNSERQQDRDGENMWVSLRCGWLVCLDLGPDTERLGSVGGALLMETGLQTKWQMNKWRWTSTDWRMKIDECMKERTNNPSCFSLQWRQVAMYCQEGYGRVLKDWPGRWESQIEGTKFTKQWKLLKAVKIRGFIMQQCQK